MSLFRLQVAPNGGHVGSVVGVGVRVAVGVIVGVDDGVISGVAEGGAGVNVGPAVGVAMGSLLAQVTLGQPRLSRQTMYTIPSSSTARSEVHGIPGAIAPDSAFTITFGLSHVNPSSVDLV